MFAPPAFPIHLLKYGCGIPGRPARLPFRLRSLPRRAYQFYLKQAERFIDYLINLEPLTPAQSGLAICFVPIVWALVFVINATP